MGHGTQGVQGKSNTPPLFWNSNDRKDVDASVAFKHELKMGNAFDFAKKHPEFQAAQTGGASIW